MSIGDKVKYTPEKYDPYNRFDDRIGMTGIITRIRVFATGEAFYVLLSDYRRLVTAEKNLTKVYTEDQSL